MLFHEVLNQTGLTRKAVEYYIDHGLLHPNTQSNGYRSFSEDDISRLKQISAYRKLGLNIADIRCILNGNEKQVISQLLLRHNLSSQFADQKQALLQALYSGVSIDTLFDQIQALSAQETIAERLLFTFPGYWGQYLALHFAQFLQFPIKTQVQQQALKTIIEWLDHLAPLEFPDDLIAFLDETTRNTSFQQMQDIHDAVLAAIKAPDVYFREHEDMIREYLKIQDCEEYLASPAARLKEIMVTFQQENGYNDVFLPAMELLSPVYADYRRNLEIANHSLLNILGTQHS